MRSCAWWGVGSVALVVSPWLFAISATRAGDIAGPYFTNVTDQAGLAGKPGFRLSVADLDGDNYPDILLIRQQDDGTGAVLDKQYLYLNRPCAGNPDPLCRTFIDVTAASNIRANRQGTAEGRHQDGAVFADVDNDGDLDMFSIVYVHRNYTLDKGRNDLLLNDGAAHFTLAPNSPFHLEPIWNTAAAVFMDYDNDGAADLFLGNWYNTGDVAIEQKLYHGHGDGGFTNVTAAAGIAGAASAVYGVASADWNNDGFTDLFAPCYGWTVPYAKSIHWRNNGNGTFTRVEDQTRYSQYTGFPSGKASFGSMPRDYDNSGTIDMLEVLTHGAGDGDGSVHTAPLTNTANVFTWDFGRVTGRTAEDNDITHHGDHYAGWFDFDGDGLVDFVLSECCYSAPSGGNNNRIYLFKQASNHVFTAVTRDSGLWPINEAQLPVHDVIPLDYDLDGDEDLLVGFADDINGIELWRNDVGTQQNWITLRLRGAGIAGHANRSAIGARVELTAGGVTQTREVYAGNGHMGPQAPLALSFGLGTAGTVDRIRVRWPNAGLTWTELTAIPSNQFLTIAEPCPVPGDPSALVVAKAGPDLRLTWADPALPGLTWNVFRDGGPDPRLWGDPHARNVTDQDPGTAGIQYTDLGAVAGSSPFFYLVVAVNDCGASPLY